MLSDSSIVIVRTHCSHILTYIKPILMFSWTQTFQTASSYICYALIQKIQSGKKTWKWCQTVLRHKAKKPLSLFLLWHHNSWFKSSFKIRLPKDHWNYAFFPKALILGWLLFNHNDTKHVIALFWKTCFYIQLRTCQILLNC